MCGEHATVEEYPMLQRAFPVLVALIALASATSVLPASRGASAEEARSASHREFARSAIDDLFSEIRSNAKARQGDRAELEAIVLRILAPHVDFEAMTRVAAGRAWRDMTPADRAALAAEFRTLLIRFYSGMLAQYADYDYRILAREEHPAGDEALVVVELRKRGLQGGPVVRVNALVRAGSGGAWRVVDLSVDGVSIVQSYREGFREDLKRLGVSGLIEKLRRMNGNSGEKVPSVNGRDASVVPVFSFPEDIEEATSVRSSFKRRPRCCRHRWRLFSPRRAVL